MSQSTPPHSELQVAALRSGLCGCLTIALGLTDLVGWLLGKSELITFVGGRIAMNPTTAVVFVAGGWALLGLRRENANWDALLALIAAFMVLVGLLRMADSGSWFPIHIDLYLFAEQMRRSPDATRLSVTTAFNFVCLGLAIALRNSWPRSPAQPSQVLAAIPGLTSCVALLGYAFGVRNTVDFGSYVPMSMPTAAAFLCLSGGLFLAYPRRGAMTIVNAPGSAGLVTRRLLVGGSLLCVAAGWLTLAGEHLNLYRPVLGIALFATVAGASFVALVLWNGETLRRLDYEEAQHALLLKESEERFKLLSGAAFEGILVSVNGILQDVNDRSCEMFGYTHDEFVGMPLLNLVAAEMHDHVRRSVAQDDGHHYNSVAVRKDGTWFECEVVGRGATLEHGLRARVSAIRDITQLKEVERLKDEFVSIVSHELRTPLTSIHGALGLMSGGAMGELPPPAREMVTLAMRNSQRLLALINDILDMQKIESGTLDFTLATLDLCELVQASVAVNQPMAAGLGVRLKLVTAPQPVWVRGDAGRLMQVMCNLLSNAAKFSPEAAEVEVRMAVVGERVTVEVADQGEGIPESFRSVIFRKFAQADSSSTRAKGGTGLGLNIARAIVERHGGTIYFDTQTGTGTTFCFELPVAPSAAQPASGGSALPSDGTDSMAADAASRD